SGVLGLSPTSGSLLKSGPASPAPPSPASPARACSLCPITSSPPKWMAEIERDDIDMLKELGSLTTANLMEKVRGLQNLAYQLGLDEIPGSYDNSTSDSFEELPSLPYWLPHFTFPPTVWEFHQRDDTGEISQHSGETQEVAAACGWDWSSDDVGCPSRTDPPPCSWHSAPPRTFGGKRGICSVESQQKDERGYSASFRTLTISALDVGDTREHIILKGQSSVLSFQKVMQEPQDLTPDLIQ
uniref:Protein lin-52 homolog n=1 Tax=Neovison vison TaxID=452646 RepID=A0A8C7BD03_NEOVI